MWGIDSIRMTYIESNVRIITRTQAVRGTIAIGSFATRALQTHDVLHSQSVGAYAFARNVAYAPRSLPDIRRIAPPRARTSNRDSSTHRCSPHFWSDVHPASRSGDTRSFAARRSCSPGSPCVKHWWKGAATLQMRALCTIGTASKPPASQAFKPAPYCPPVHVLTVCSAPVNRVQSESVCGPIFSSYFGLQRCCSMPPHGMGMACKWERRRMLRGRSRSVE